MGRKGVAQLEKFPNLRTNKLTNCRNLQTALPWDNGFGSGTSKYAYVRIWKEEIFGIGNCSIHFGIVLWFISRDL